MYETYAVISSDKVQGTTVYSTAGDKLSGQVRHAVLEFGGFLGIETDRYPLPWNMLKYDSDKDGYVVALDKARLETALRYPEHDVSAYTDDYGRDVHGYYDQPF